VAVYEVTDSAQCELRHHLLERIPTQVAYVLQILRETIGETRTCRQCGVREHLAEPGWRAEGVDQRRAAGGDADNWALDAQMG
jgi:hypothetical protein